MKRDAWGSRFPRLSAWLDRLHARYYEVPPCGPEGCYCRRTCSWILGVSLDEYLSCGGNLEAIRAIRQARAGR